MKFDVVLQGKRYRRTVVKVRDIFSQFADVLEFFIFLDQRVKDQAPDPFGVGRNVIADYYT